MEFIKFDEAMAALIEIGIQATVHNDDCLHLEANPDQHRDLVRHLHLADDASASGAHNDARRITMPTFQLADAIDSMVGQLHLSQLLLLPVGKWRDVFDAVAFVLATHEDWQAVDAMATLELSTRDPLLCNPGDYRTVHALINAIFSDAELPNQGIIVTSTATPFVAEVVPDGAVRVMVGNQVLADEIEEGLKI